MKNRISFKRIVTTCFTPCSIPFFLGMLFSSPVFASDSPIQSLADFDRSAEDNQVPVIINLKAPSSDNSARARSRQDHLINKGGWVSLDNYISEAQTKFANEMGWVNFNDLIALKTVPAMAKSVSREEMKQLLASGAVESVYEQKEVFPSLVSSLQTIHLPVADETYKGGKGYAVAILDTAIDSNHPFIRDRVVAEACFSAIKECPNGQVAMVGKGAAQPTERCVAKGDCSHGTHVAGIAAGSMGKLKGVAPDANIVAVKVLNAQGRNHDAQILAAVDWISTVREKYNIAAINMSLGGGGPYTGHCDRSGGGIYYKLFTRLKEQGVATIIASGNDASDKKGFLGGIASPACVRNAISVGALDNKGEQAAVYSNSASFVSIMAPGGDYSAGNAIYSSIPEKAGAVLKSKIPCTENNLFCGFQGTSMAAPHVAGAWVALKSSAPQKSYNDIYRALISTTQFTDKRNGLRFPTLNVQQSLSLLNTQTAKPKPSEPAPPKARPEAPAKEPTPPQPAPPPRARAPQPEPPAQPPAQAEPEPAPPPKQERERYRRVDGILIENQSSSDTFEW